MGQFYSYNPNPRRASVGDCAVRAVAKALDIGWYESFALLAAEALEQCDLPSANNVFGAVLRKHGFQRENIPNECPDCYSVADFIREHTVGTYVVVLKNHVATVQDGALYDTWNSLDEIILYFWRAK